MKRNEGERMQNEKEVSRRAVLCGLAVLTLGFVPETAIAATGVKVLANGKVEISLSANKTLKSVGGVVQFTDGSGQPMALVRTGKETNGFKALNLSCTHQGGIVEKVGAKWICPIHRAEYTINGEVKVGPARRNLVEVPVKASATKVVVG